jgi:hypothetical protein
MDGNHHKRFAKEFSERIEALARQVQSGFTAVNPVKPAGVPASMKCLLSISF